MAGKIKRYFFPKKEFLALNHQYYGTIYTPKYNLSVPFDNTKAKIYNEKGELLEPVYLRNDLNSHISYSNSDRVFFDRYNFSLQRHFYSQVNLFEQCGKPVNKYALFEESEAILPETYQIFTKNKGLEKDFDYIFTFSENLLDKYSNSRFVPFSASPWYKERTQGGVLVNEIYNLKSKNISIMASDKKSTYYHKLRIDIAKKCKNQNLADTFGTFDGSPYLKDISVAFEPYRYSIVIENDKKTYYFTEKITNCFAAMTVPIYIGADKISDFFNEDGIIIMSPSDYDNLDVFLSQCSEQDYLSRLSAIKDNYERVQQYRNVFDNFLYDKYLKQ